MRSKAPSRKQRKGNRRRQVGRILFALDALDRRKPQERGQRSVTTAPRFGLNMILPNVVPELVLSLMIFHRKNRAQRVLVNAEGLERELLDNKGLGAGVPLYGEGRDSGEAPVEFSWKESGFTSLDPRFGSTAPLCRMHLTGL